MATHNPRKAVLVYSGIFVVLMALSTTQAGLESIGLLEDNYWPVFAAIIAISSLKALAVAGYYMHLRDEPRSVSYLALGGLLCVLALTAGAGYSIL